MHLFLLGGTGRVGRLVAAQALAAGHRVTALVRSPGAWEGPVPETLRLIQGDACAKDDIRRAMEGVQAVISCLGTDGETVLTESAPYMISSMKEHAIQRIITVGTAGILQSREHPALLRYESPETRRSSTRAAEEHRRAWELLAGSDLAWTVVCPTYLPEGPRTGVYRVEPHTLPAGGMSISTGDTAEFTYQTAVDEAWPYARCRVGICY